MSGEKLFVGQVVMVKYDGWTGPFVIESIKKRWFDECESSVMDGYKDKEPKDSKDYHYCPLITLKGGREYDASFVFSMKEWEKRISKEVKQAKKQAKKLEESK